MNRRFWEMSDEDVRADDARFFAAEAARREHEDNDESDDDAEVCS